MAEPGKPRKRKKPSASGESARRKRPAKKTSSRDRAMASLPAEPASKEAKPSPLGPGRWPLLVGGAVVVLVIGVLAWSFRGGDVDELADVEPVPAVAAVTPTESDSPETDSEKPAADAKRVESRTSPDDEGRDNEAERIAEAERRQAEFEQAAVGGKPATEAAGTSGTSTGSSPLDAIAGLDLGGFDEELLAELEPKEVAEFARLPGDWSMVRALGLAPDGTRLYLGLADGSVACVDVESRREVWRWADDSETDAEGDRLQALVVSPDGATLVVAGSDAIVLIDATSGDRRHVASVKSPVTVLVAVGETFVAGHADGTVARHSFTSGSPNGTATIESAVTAATVCGEQLVVGDWTGYLHVLDATTLEPAAEPIALHDSAIHSIVGNERVATAAANDGRIASAWLEEVEVARRYELRSPRPLARIDIVSVLSGREDGVLELWEERTETITHRLVGHDAPVHSVACDADERMVVTAAWDGSVRFWELPR